MNIKELLKEEQEYYDIKAKFINAQADNSFPKTWICPKHKVRVRNGYECPKCKYPELEKGRHSDPIKNERERRMRENPEYLEKRKKQWRERSKRISLRRMEHHI